MSRLVDQVMRCDADTPAGRRGDTVRPSARVPKNSPSESSGGTHEIHMLKPFARRVPP